MRDQNPLVGKVITAIWLAEDRAAIRFDVSDGPLVARAEGDCCSHTWIEDVLDPAAIIGSEVLRVVDLDLPDQLRQPTKTAHYEEEMQFYGLAIETENGRCTIAYRNSSNGYYGGSLSWPGERYYGGVYSQNVSSEHWRVLAHAGDQQENGR
jgi:hypothetical protein